MAEYLALMWDIKPESQDAVRELFHNYGRPDHTIRDEEGNEVGTLISTQVFMKDATVVRVVETTDGVPSPRSPGTWASSRRSASSRTSSTSTWQSPATCRPRRRARVLHQELHGAASSVAEHDE